MNSLLAFLLSSALAGLAAYKKALTKGGIITAFVLCIIICCFGGLNAFVILAITFMLVVAADKLAGKRADPRSIRKKSGARDTTRVLCNVGIPALALSLFGITGERKFLFVYAAVMAESLSDSLASKLGPLSGGKTVDICTFREISPGLSGGVSAGGSGAAFIGALVIGAISMAFEGAVIESGLSVALLGFFGCIVDSLIGSLAQVKYVCPVCGMVIERDYHCGVNAVLHKGLRPINNDIVNLMSNALMFIISSFIFL